MHNPFDSWHQLQRFSIRKLSVGVVSATIGTAVVGVMLPGDTHHSPSQVETEQRALQYVSSPEASVLQDAGVTVLPIEDSHVQDQAVSSLPTGSEELHLPTVEETYPADDTDLAVTEPTQSFQISSDESASHLPVVSPETQIVSSEPLVEPPVSEETSLSDSVTEQGEDPQEELSSDAAIVSIVSDPQEVAKKEPEASLQPETAEETPVSEPSLDMPVSPDQSVAVYPSDSSQESPVLTASDEEPVLAIEEPAASLTQAELYKPVGRRLLVSVGSSIVPKDLIDQSSELPSDVQIDWVEQPGKLVAGSSKTVRVLVRFSDGSQREVTSILSVNAQQAQRYSPEGRQLTLTVNQLVQAKEFIRNQAQLPEDVTYSFVRQPNLQTPGNKTAKVRVTYSDHSYEEVTVRLTVQRETAKPVTTAPTINLATIATDDVINKTESEETLDLTGTVTNLQAGDQVIIKVGDISQTVDIFNGTFRTSLSASHLLTHAALRADVVRNGQVLASSIRPYQVKTTLANPDVTIKDIAGDNIINLEESRNGIVISGLVNGAREGDEVEISCGCPTCQGVQWITKQARVEQGGFNISFEGSDLISDGRTVIKAKVTATDGYGNTAIGEKERSYEVDIIPPAPSLVYNQITTGNIINQATDNTVTISGDIINLQPGETGTVVATIAGRVHHLTIENGRYSLTLPKTDLADGTKVTLDLTVTDRAGNKTVLPTQEQTYTYDVTLAEPVLHLDAPAVLNSRAAELVLTGRLDYADDVRDATVQVNIKGQTYDAQVTGKSWRLALPAQGFKTEQGDVAYTVTARVTDKANNTAQTTQTSHFTVDTQGPVLAIQLRQLLTVPATGSSAITLNGQVTGHKANDQLIVTVGSHEERVTLTTDGQFSLPLTSKQLRANASRQLTARVTSTDEHDNTGAVSESLRYEVATTSSETGLELNLITSDDHINVTEAKEATTRISGRVTGQPATSNARLVMGETVVDAPITDGAFTAEVKTELLIKNPTYKVVAELNGKSVERTYTVDPWAISQVYITSVSDTASLLDNKDKVDVTGTVNLNSGTLAKFENASFIKSVTAKLNGKTYTAGLSDTNQNLLKRFTLSIPKEDLQEAQGKEITFALPEKIKVYRVKTGNYNDQTSVETEYAALNNQAHYVLDDNPYIQNRQVVQSVSVAETTITGKASGHVQVGDKVKVKIGDTIKETQLLDNKTFVLTLPTTLLQQNTTKEIAVSLESNDYANRPTIISTKQGYHTGQASGHSAITIDTDADNLPYFIKALRYIGNPGFLQRIPVGTKANLTYNFKVKNSVFTPYNQNNRDATSRALEKISSYANVDFKKLDNDLDMANLEFGFMTMSNGANGAAGHGGIDVKLNKRTFQNTDTHDGITFRPGYQTTIHEVFHTLGAIHPFVGTVRLSSHENDRNVTVMAYNNKHVDYNVDMGVFDLAYLHYRYGVRETARQGDNTYGFKTVDPSKADSDVYIWDGSGIDTFDASDQTEGVTVNLTPGSWNYVGNAPTERFLVEEGRAWNLEEFYGDATASTFSSRIQAQVDNYKVTYTKGQSFIGYGTQIERLIGSNHADKLTGNAADNDIFGGKGADIIDGGAGNDFIDGGEGIDIMTGGAGDDTFVVDDSHDKVNELPGDDQGKDTVLAYADYTLPDNVENLVLLGTATTGQGNAANNVITGNDQANILTGNGGADTFVFASPLNGNVDTITDFEEDDVLQLDPTVFIGLTAENIADYITYDSETGLVSYDPDGRGDKDAINFAQLKPNLVFTTRNVVVS